MIEHDAPFATVRAHGVRHDATMDHTDTKFCPSCETFVRYLSCPDHSYCTACDTKVRLFLEIPKATTHFIRRIAAIARKNA